MMPNRTCQGVSRLPFLGRSSMAERPPVKRMTRVQLPLTQPPAGRRCVGYLLGPRLSATDLPCSGRRAVVFHHHNLARSAFHEPCLLDDVELQCFAPGCIPDDCFVQRHRPSGTTSFCSKHVYLNFVERKRCALGCLPNDCFVQRHRPSGTTSFCSKHVYLNFVERKRCALGCLPNDCFVQRHRPSGTTSFCPCSTMASAPVSHTGDGGSIPLRDTI